MKHTPSDLAEPGAKFWKDFLSEMEPETASEYALLETVCTLQDRIKDCQDAITRDGNYVKDGSKLLVHPALKDLQRFTSLLLRGLQDLQVKKPVGRPENTTKSPKKGRGIA